MSEEDSAEFGPFGDIKPVGRRPLIIVRLIKLAAVIALLAFLPTAIKGWNEFYNNLAEQDPPSIRFLKPPSGIGLDPVELRIQLGDRQSGLDEVVARIEQNGKVVQTLLTKSYPAKLNEDVLSLTLKGKELGLREGQARVSITVFDRSFWSSSTNRSLELNVDYRPPGIEVLTKQHNAVRTGVELVFYRLIGDPEAFSGVTVGSTLFPGFAAKRWDPEFEKVPDVHFALFSIPRGFDAENERITVIARDSVGNSSTSSIFFRVREIPPNSAKVNLSAQFMETKVEEFYKKYLEMRAKLRGGAPPEFIPAIRTEERIERFRAVNESFRALVEEAAKPFLQRPKTQRYWSGKFSRLPGQKLAPLSGELLQYFFEGQEIGSYRNEGIYFKIAAGTEIRAANDGVVIFADELGTYGRTLILDHGFGLTTMYSGLETLQRIEGDRLTRNDVIGSAGSSAFVDKEECTGFEMRLNGVPIRVEEWWDQTWIQAHIRDKVNSVKRSLGLEVRTALE